MPAATGPGTTTATPVVLPANAAVTLGTAPVSGVQYVSVTFDRAGLNAAGTATSVLLRIWANAGSGFYEICSCRTTGGGTASTGNLTVSTWEPETAPMVTGTMVTAAAVASVSITPTVAVAAQAVT